MNKIDEYGRYQRAKKFKSPFCDARPEKSVISLLVIHCISLPEGHYAGGAIHDLFMGRLDCQTHSSFSILQNLQVSAHCVIYRDGHIQQYVPFSLRAWHAGDSSFMGVSKCNDYSIGIELEGTVYSSYTNAQYHALAKLTDQIKLNYPRINNTRIAAHSDIAPRRKQDPGKKFDWQYYFSLLKL
ncbi:1,6-anhydro-N-acetylmuramyl-L-alanine amidase AmpD [Psychromonas sp. CD1]|uniref:1,6-anhydro-N-acetylmuramyl-L-alanine amidase AmpD n=1 Tax=Psychromonas sp. CD1 TaxID=1979839 RepID=UPI000B9B56AA|nr:1,6-anhydro-N-acetylmuramyl-L-alanine amidase AmpD [Psychromonas sp. CD1]